MQKNNANIYNSLIDKTTDCAFAALLFSLAVRKQYLICVNINCIIIYQENQCK